MFQGSMVAIVTPMKADGAVDDDGLSRLIEFHIEQGTDAIVSVGTTGESATLSMSEHAQVVQRTINLVAGRVPVIAGSGANNTREAIELALKAEKAGAAAHLSVVPYYNKPTQNGMIAHFRAIADAVELPMILYNVPGRTVVDMLPETTAALAAHERIVGIKEAEGSLERTRALLDQCPDDFIVLSGEDPSACESILLGAKGVISVTANVAPAMMHDMCAAALRGDADDARALNSRLEPVHRAMFAQSSPAPAKWSLTEMGLIQPHVRLPLLALEDSCFDTVREALEAADCLAVA
ncbi:MAG: 4-hydroxy-tetrahydrodipicolinate synthase [Pseudomonadota bacterium]